MGKNKRWKVHRQWLHGRSLCSIRSNRKWYKRRGSSLECQNCFFVYPIIDSNLKNLSKRDLLVIEYIRMQNPELYKIIYDNRKFFISDGTMYDLDLYVISFHRDEYEKEAKAFFHKLFENKEHEKYYKILVQIFPNINKYSEKINYHGNEIVSANEIEKTRGIANAKYFSLYFSETENAFSMLGGEVETFIKDLNEGKENIEEKFSALLKLYNASLNREMLEAMQLYIPEIEKNVCYRFLKILIDNYWDIDNRLEFLLASARRRSCIIIWELMQRINDEQYTDLVTSLSEAYDKIQMIESISTEYESNKNRGVSVPERDEIWKDLEDNLLTNILENSINLYDDIYYHPHNIWALYRKNKENTAIFRTYIRNICSKKSIFRILYDIMGHSVGSGHTYYFSRERIECFFEDDELKKYVQDIEATTEDESFLMELYKKYLEHPNDKDGMRTGMPFPEERKMNF